MHFHCSPIKGLSPDMFSTILPQLIEKFGRNFKMKDSIPQEIQNFLKISSDKNFILEAIDLLSSKNIMKQRLPFVIELWRNILLDEDYFVFAFVRMSETDVDYTTKNQIEQFIQQIICLPGKVANEMGSAFPKEFELKPFSALIMLDILKAFHIICQLNDIKQSQVYGFDFLSTLASRIFMNFNVDNSPVLINSIAVIALLTNYDVYNDGIRQFMKGLQRQAIHIVAKIIFEHQEDSGRIKSMLHDIWNKSSDWRFVVTKKIPLLTFTKNDLAIKNIVHLLATEDIKTMENLLIEMFTVWSLKSHISETPFEQHFYITKFIILMVRYLPNVHQYADKIKRILFNGMQLHIGSTDKKLSALGMITAEIVLGILDSEAKDDEKLKFDYSEMNPEIVTEVVDVLRLFPQNVLQSLDTAKTDGDQELTKAMENLISISRGTETKDMNNEDLIVQQRPTEIKIPDLSNVEIKQQLPEELDSDDDLEPYPEPDRMHLDEKRPKFLLDLIKFFSTTECNDDAEKFEESMKSAEEIIQQQLQLHHSDLAIDLLRIFLTLDKKCYLENFNELKMNILLKLCTIHPQVCAQYLCNEFNTENTKYSLATRLLMLDILTETAKKLSKLKTQSDVRVEERQKITTGRNRLLIKLNEELEERNRKDSQRIISDRLQAKTRRITTRTLPLYETAGINKFGEVAGWFFFPLIEGFGRKQMLFTSGTSLKYDTDNLLLAKFINTISVLMLCAENSIIAPKMAREIFNLSIFLRYHQESRVRLAVLHMVAAVLIAIPAKLVSIDFPNQIQEFMNHLQLITKNTVVNYEPDKDCREFALQLFAMCQNALISDN